MKDFEEVYEKIHEKFDIIIGEKRRKLISYLIITIIIIIAAVYLYLEYGVRNVIISIVLGFLALFVIVKMVFDFYKYKKFFKSEVIKNFVKEINDGFAYYPEDRIDRNVYNEGMFINHFDRISSEDIISGRLKNGTAFRMGEVLLEDKHYDSETKQTEYHTLFKGVFAKISLKVDKQFSKIKIRKDSKFLNSKEKLELESLNFEKKYDFYAENKIEALMLFTTDVINKIDELSEKYNKKLELTIYNSNLYVQFSNSDLFEPKIIRNPMDKAALKKYYSTIEIIYELANYFTNNINNKNF